MKVITDVKNNKRIIAWYVVVLIVINSILMFIPSIFSKGEDISESFKITLAIIFWSGIFAPFFEETLMRGIIQKKLENTTSLNIKWIYFIVAILFSLLHFDMYVFPYFFTSLILSYVYDKTGKTLIVPIMIHCFYNLFVIFLNFILNR